MAGNALKLHPLHFLQHHIFFCNKAACFSRLLLTTMKNSIWFLIYLFSYPATHAALTGCHPPATLKKRWQQLLISDIDLGKPICVVVVEG